MGIVIGVLLVLVILFVGAKFYIDSLAKEKIDAKLAELNLSDKIKYEDVSVNPLTQKVTLSDVTLINTKQQEELKIKEVIFYKYDNTGNIPMFFHGAANGLQIELNKENSIVPEFVYKLKEYGHKRLELDLELDYELKADKQELEFKTLKLNEDKLFTIDSELTLGNVLFREEARKSSPLWFLAITLKSASLNLENNGLLDQVFEANAKKQNLTLGEYVNSITTEIQKKIEEETNPKLKEVMEEFVKFLKNRNEIQVTTNFKRPFSIGEFVGKLFFSSFDDNKQMDLEKYFEDYPIEVDTK